MIIREEELICIEETHNSENQMNKDQIIEIFVNIEQVFSPQTNRNLNTVKSVPAGEIVEEVRGFRGTVSDINPTPSQTITNET